MLNATCAQHTLCRRRLAQGRAAGCFNNGERLAAGVRLLGKVWRTGLRPLLLVSASSPGSDGVAAFPGGAGSGVSHRQTSTSTEQGLSACGLR
ncbi:hypothetical protein [Pectobacterium versatile]|uniref:hypothetical protein n=1 Tax=Pectobacterium versatile TaxID=2488639 RepID=UPI001CCEC8D5|nr:hypothetical protein [Pectobacterium versatile]